MTDDAICDEHVFSMLGGDIGEEDAREVLGCFLTDTHAKIGRCAAGADRALVQREAHAIKSSAATLGFRRLSAVALDIELSAPVSDDADLGAKTDLLRRSFEEARSFARRHLLVPTEDFAP